MIFPATQGVLMAALRAAGFVQLSIALANFTLPKQLRYRENLGRVTPIIRQIFVVHSGYIVGILLLFAAITLGFSSDLASGSGLGRFLSASLALFWFCRIPVQLFYYDSDVRRANRVGDLAMSAALVFLSATYACAALA